MDIRILHLTHSGINKQLWDACIQSSTHPLLYATSTYLDTMSEGWQALVLNNYEAVMPLLIKKKWGVTYLHQPYGVAQSGIFSGMPVTTAILEAFVQKTLSLFRFGSIDFNEGNPIISMPAGNLTQRTNFIINLHQPYANLQLAYTKDARKNLRQAHKHQQRLQYNIPLEQVMDAYTRLHGRKNKLHIANATRYMQLLNRLLEQQQLFTVGVITEDNELLAAAAFGTFVNRISYLLGAPTERGKKFGSLHLLIDSVLQQYASQPLLFDFEGSDIPSVAMFYKKFGPAAHYYQHWHFNRLPGILRLFKS